MILQFPMGRVGARLELGMFSVLHNTSTTIYHTCVGKFRMRCAVSGLLRRKWKLAVLYTAARPTDGDTIGYSGPQIPFGKRYEISDSG